MIEVLFFGGGHIAIRFEHTRDAFGIVHVHLASEGVYVEHALASRGGVFCGRFRKFRARSASVIMSSFIAFHAIGRDSHHAPYAP